MGLLLRIQPAYRLLWASFLGSLGANLIHFFLTFPLEARGFGRQAIGLAQAVLLAVGVVAALPLAYLIPRLGYGPSLHLAFALALLGGNLERVAVELRHLQRTEVLEAEEPFREGQTGSSSMPHKKNPVGLENLTGVARLLRGYLSPALENIALWHEGYISLSGAVMVILPDATALAHDA